MTRLGCYQQEEIFMNDNHMLPKAVAILRITLGVIILATWYDNLDKGLYTAAGLTNFLNWLFEGNGSTLSFYKSFLDAVIIPNAALFGKIQIVGEGLMGLALLLGGLTRLFGIAAIIFFLNLFLSYFGGHEWIWVYVILFSSSLTVAMGAAGRKWGLDEWLIKTGRARPHPVFW
jgi:uncharacterized membrane protein YphA (DoxX/SURF4 family)